MLTPDSNTGLTNELEVDHDPESNTGDYVTWNKYPNSELYTVSTHESESDNNLDYYTRPKTKSEHPSP